jgi:putative endonuclease
MYYIYIIYSASSDIYYVGQSQDYRSRLEQHNSSPEDTFTRKHRPWTLCAVFSCDDRSQAVKIERLIKKQKSRRFIERLIKSDKLTGEYAHLVRVPIQN